MRICRDCYYSVPIDGEVDLLECRRYPPVAGFVEDGVATAFPACEPTTWCGEWMRAVEPGGPSNYAQEW